MRFPLNALIISLLPLALSAQAADRVAAAPLPAASRRVVVGPLERAGVYTTNAAPPVRSPLERGGRGGRRPLRPEGRQSRPGASHLHDAAAWRRAEAGAAWRRQHLGEGHGEGLFR